MAPSTQVLKITIYTLKAANSYLIYNSSNTYSWLKFESQSQIGKTYVTAYAIN